MSEAARKRLDRRQHWAAPGGRHDRIVKYLQIILPSAIGVLAAFLAMAPLQTNNELSFLLSRDNVEIAAERLRVEAARYSGADGAGRPFELNAASALQRSSSTPIVELEDLSAQLELEDGLAFIVANRGFYDLEEEIVTIDGPLEFRAADGYRLRTSNVLVQLDEREMRSAGEVDGQIPLGAFSADRMRVDLPTRTVFLEGDARLRIVQGAGR
ncbi:LPS export ABC transporter periplasmic protein LptC [Parasphingopyxis algicola]|uniref:LPS export ABC transporter periplasmic protein LptC n=1 Tax=Parasphingopyxis algicola TaxID=2026624 RepID=UPI0015A4803B|nr:LPS export ABC transporter periplasmic protein LptC [Parasphingopyxis algicola]QLC25314.1 LPS export ABC transporter periplasmic protein LptC [Parasphingopyxis algicola]